MSLPAGNDGKITLTFVRVGLRQVLRSGLWAYQPLEVSAEALFDPYFAEERNRAQRGKVPCPRSRSQ